MADNEVIIEVNARLDKAEAAIKRFEGVAKDSGEKAGSGFSDGFNDIAKKGFKALAVAAAAALAGVVVVFKQGIDAAIEQENATNALNQALARTGQYSAAAAKDMDAFASSMQKSTVFSDDAILTNAALIQSLGKLSVGGLKEATQASADLSAALGIDLRSASQLVGKAAAGEIGTFGRYGIVIKEGATAAETFANAMTKINSQFGGAAAAQANTFGGQMEKAKNAMGDLLEEIGNLIIKSPEIAAIFKYVSGIVSTATESIKGFSGEGGLRGIILAGIDVANFFVSILGPVLDMIKNLFVGLGTAIGGFASAFVSLISGDFRGAIDTIGTLATEGMAGLSTIFNAEGTKVAWNFLEGLKTTVETAAPLVAEGLKNTVVTAMAPLSTVFDSFKASFKSTAEEFKIINDNMVKSTVAQLRGTLATGVGSAFSAIGGALVKGENVFAAFGKAILGMFGDMALQLGQFYLTLGIANLWLNPAAAAGQIAGGAALLVLGGALKALAGGGGGGEAASASGGGSAASAPVGTSTSNLQSPEQQQPGTAVTVNVAGNILDRRETGLEIANIINESFATGGIVMARGAIV